MYSRKHKSQIANHVNRQWLKSEKTAKMSSSEVIVTNQTKNNDFSFVPAISSDSSAGSQHPLYFLFMLMMLSSCVIGQVEAAAQKPRQSEKKIHGQFPKLLPDSFACAEKSQGVSDGMVCYNLESQGNTKFYLKKLSPQLTFEKPCLSLSYFNAKFVSSVIGVKSPHFRFFQVDNMHTNGPEFFIGSREMKINFFNSAKEVIEKISGAEIAKLIISKLFIDDLHFSNYAYTNDGKIALVDLDSNNYLPTKLNHYLTIAIKDIATPLTPPLSLDNVDLIIERLRAMKLSKLPAFSEQFGLDVDSYQQLLDIYIKCFYESKDFFSNRSFANPLVMEDGNVSKSTHSYAVNGFLRNVLSSAMDEWIAEHKNVGPSVLAPYCFV